MAQSNKNKKSLDDQFYTVEQAAEILHIKPDTLRRKLSAKKLKGFKKFGRWYIFKSDLSDYVTSDNNE